MLKVLALLSQIRWYNISLLLLGQYLTACFVFAPVDLRWNILLDINTHLIAWSGAFILAFGFLINSFYDYAVDTINRPKQSSFERLVSKRTSLNTAISLLALGLLGAWLVGFKALLFWTFCCWALVPQSPFEEFTHSISYQCCYPCTHPVFWNVCIS